MIQLYDHAESGNCYKIRLLLTHLEIPYQRIDVAVTGDRDAQRGTAFFAKNPIGKIPTVVLPDGVCLAESTAILWYFALGTQLLPTDKLEQCQVLQWLAFEQNNHEPNIATARHQMSHEPGANPSPEQIASWRNGGNRALSVMERHLAQHEFFAAGRYTIADIALFAYTHVAEEGCVELAPYPAVRRWLDRIRAQPGWIPMH